MRRKGKAGAGINWGGKGWMHEHSNVQHGGNVEQCAVLADRDGR